MFLSFLNFAIRVKSTVKRNVAFGVVAGAIVGVAIGVLTTTKHGRDFGRQISRKAKGFFIYGKKFFQNIPKDSSVKNRSWWWNKEK